MCRGKAFLKKQPHRIALIPKGRLHADKDIAKVMTQDEHTASVRLDFTRGRAPNGLDLGKWRCCANDRIGINMGGHVGLLAVLRRIALQDHCAQRVDAFRHIKRVTFGFHPCQRVKQAFENTQISRCTDCARIRRETKQDNANLLFGILLAAQFCQTQCLFGQAGDALMAWCHCLAFRSGVAHFCTAVASIPAVATSKHCRVCRAINLWQGDKHRCLDRAKALTTIRPLAQGLELERLGRNIRHIQLFEQLNRGRTVVICRTTNE